MFLFFINLDLVPPVCVVFDLGASFRIRVFLVDQSVAAFNFLLGSDGILASDIEFDPILTSYNFYFFLKISGRFCRFKLN